MEAATKELTVSRGSAMPAPIVRETGELVVALQSPRIDQSSLEEIKQVLRLVMVKIGLRAANWPTPEETAVLIEHIVTNYPGNTVSEIKLAFDKAVCGGLNVEANCYENFSCAYFSTIMNAYREWAAQEHRQSIKSEPPVQTVLTAEQLENGMREDIEIFYQRLRNGHIPRQGIPVYFREVMVKDGLIEKDADLSLFFSERLNKGIENIYVRS